MKISCSRASLCFLPGCASASSWRCVDAQSSKFSEWKFFVQEEEKALVGSWRVSFLLAALCDSGAGLETTCQNVAPSCHY